MKRIFRYFPIALLVASFAACSNENTEQTEETAATETESVISAEQVDSLSSLFGLLAGHDTYLRHQQLIASGDIQNLDGEAFIDGVKVALSGDTDGYTQGVDGAHYIIAWIVDVERRTGKKVNIDMLLRGIESTLKADSLSADQAAEIATNYNALYQRY